MCLSPWPAAELEREEPQTESLLASVLFGLIPSPSPWRITPNRLIFVAGKRKPTVWVPKPALASPATHSQEEARGTKGAPARKPRLSADAPRRGKGEHPPEHSQPGRGQNFAAQGSPELPGSRRLQALDGHPPPDIPSSTTTVAFRTQGGGPGPRGAARIWASLRARGTRDARPPSGRPPLAF